MLQMSTYTAQSTNVKEVAGLFICECYSGLE